MRVVIATPLYPPEIGGPATYAKLLSEGLPKLGRSDLPKIEVEVVKFSDVRHLPKIFRHLAYFWRVRVAAKGADVVLALDPVSTGLPALLAARCMKKPFVVKIVGDYAWEQGKQRFGITQNLDEFVKEKSVPFLVRVLRRIQTHVAQSATRIIVPSEYLKGIIAEWGISCEKINVIYNAVTLEEIGVVPEVVMKLSRPLVVTSGRLVPWKGIDGVIDAVALIHEKSVTAWLAIAGDGPECGTLQDRANEKLGTSCVLTGSLSHADMLATMKYADVFVLNSSYEGLSHVLIEALALGKPIIATRAGGNEEVITHNQTGLIVSVGDVDALSTALENILLDAHLAMRLSVAARESAKRFSIETMLVATAHVLKNI